MRNPIIQLSHSWGSTAFHSYRGAECRREKNKKKNTNSWNQINRTRRNSLFFSGGPVKIKTQFKQQNPILLFSHGPHLENTQLTKDSWLQNYPQYAFDGVYSFGIDWFSFIHTHGLFATKLPSKRFQMGLTIRDILVSFYPLWIKKTETLQKIRFQFATISASIAFFSPLCF